MNYMLTRYENGREVITTYGDCTLDSMRRTVENSPETFREGYVIYEMKPVEYGIQK